MPYFDGTGPRGQGPLTGRGMGNCVVPANKLTSKNWLGKVTANSRIRFGAGRGLGLGRRRRMW